MKAIIYERYLASDKRDCMPMLTEYCQQQGFEIHKILKDEGAKIYEENFPKFQELMEDVRNKNFDVLVSRNILSLSRGARHSMKILKDFVNNGIHFVFLESDINSLNQPVVFDLIKTLTKFHDQAYYERRKFSIEHLKQQNRHLGRKYKIDSMLPKDVLESKSNKELMIMFSVSNNTITRYRKRVKMMEEMQPTQIA